MFVDNSRGRGRANARDALRHLIRQHYAFCLNKLRCNWRYAVMNERYALTHLCLSHPTLPYPPRLHARTPQHIRCKCILTFDNIRVSNMLVPKVFPSSVTAQQRRNPGMNKIALLLVLLLKLLIYWFDFEALYHHCIPRYLQLNWLSAYLNLDYSGIKI